MNKTTVSISRKHIISAIEAAPITLEYPKYTITSVLIRPSKTGGYAGVKVTWKIK